MMISNAITSKEALTLLQEMRQPDIETLMRLVDRVSVTQDDIIVTLFYSGGFDDIKNWQVAERIGCQNQHVLTIGQTEAFDFITRPEFITAFEAAAERENDHYLKLYKGRMNKGEERCYFQSVWDRISHNFAKAAEGEVKTITPHSTWDSIFRQTELNTLLDNKNVTFIDGLSKDHLRNMPPEEAFESIERASANAYRKLKIEMRDNNSILVVADDGFFGEHSGIHGAGLCQNTDLVIECDKLIREDTRLQNFFADEMPIDKTPTTEIQCVGSCPLSSVTTYNHSPTH